MIETIEEICQKKGVKLTDQRKIIAKVLSESKEVMVSQIILMLMSYTKECLNLIQK